MSSEQRDGACKWDEDENTPMTPDTAPFKEPAVIPAQCEEGLKDAKDQIQTANTEVEYLGLEKKRLPLTNNAFKVSHQLYHIQLKILTV